MKSRMSCLGHIAAVTWELSLFLLAPGLCCQFIKWMVGIKPKVLMCVCVCVGGRKHVYDVCECMTSFCYHPLSCCVLWKHPHSKGFYFSPGVMHISQPRDWSSCPLSVAFLFLLSVYKLSSVWTSGEAAAHPRIFSMETAICNTDLYWAGLCGVLQLLTVSSPFLPHYMKSSVVLWWWRTVWRSASICITSNGGDAYTGDRLGLYSVFWSCWDAVQC